MVGLRRGGGHALGAPPPMVGAARPGRGCGAPAVAGRLALILHRMGIDGTDGRFDKAAPA